MSPADFWFVSLREYDVITRGRIKAKNAEVSAQRVLNQEMARLITFAFHDPKKMPDFTKAENPKASKQIDGKRGADLLRAHLNRMYYNSKRGR